MKNVNKDIYKSQELQKIFQENGIVSAYVFGSQIGGDAIKSSDIDIAVELMSDINKRERFDIRLKLIGEFGEFFKKEVDLVVLNDIKSVFFKYVIIKEGKLIYQKSDIDVAVNESRILSDYFDFRPFIEEYNKNYVQRSLQ